MALSRTEQDWQTDAELTLAFEGAGSCPHSPEALEDSRRILTLLDSASLLGELLAVIHGDGGHYTEQHGLTKATEDARL